MQPHFQQDNIYLYQGDCLDVLATLPEASVDFVVTDPPYALNFMEQSWDCFRGEAVDPAFCHWFAGFTDGEGCFSIHKKHVNGCETYDCQFVLTLRADDYPILERIHRTLRIGTLSRSAVSVRGGNPKARFAVSSKEDCLKLRDLFRAFPLRAKKAKDFEIWSDALSAWVAHTPRASWSDVVQRRNCLMASRAYVAEGIRVDPFQMFCWRWARACLRVIKPGGLLLAFGSPRTYHRLASGIEDAGWEIRDCLMWLYGTGFPKSLDISKAIDKSAGAAREIIGVKNSTYDGAHRDPSKHKSPAALSNIGDWGLTKTPHGLPLTAPATELAKRWNGWGTALKPAWEPIILAMKPLEGTFAANAEKHGVAGMNIDACRIPCEGGSPSQQRRQGAVPVGNYNGWNVPSRNGYSDLRLGETLGRWPANLLLDEDAARLLDAQTGTLTSGNNCVRTKPSSGYHGRIGKAGDVQVTYGDSGGASRFFYCSKASKKERGPGNDHPCVKPIDLMEYLLTLLSTPDGGLVLDPFAGSGTTLVAAKRLRRPCIGVELDKHNCEIAQARISEA